MLVRRGVIPRRMCKWGIRFSLVTSAMTHGCYSEEHWQQHSWLGAFDSPWLYSLHPPAASISLSLLIIWLVAVFFSHSFLFIQLLCQNCTFFLLTPPFSLSFSLTYLFDFLMTTSAFVILFSPSVLSVPSICMSFYSGQLCTRCGPFAQLLASWRRKEWDGNDLSWKIVRNNPLNRCDKG